ncbi:hypothetical protein [Aliiglaciecola sp. LCG003]|uniref:hypothetical protein n=1 Tax=Aliiglaciecola sp. LCG003 TaxID=3053655 RepID=UPI002573B696|nr:hypothetical protein [Aliiglaciecola sp. LCG003]WJG08161.1 hypothetical protein QR722_12515 [Aliiglaciecola sp. LCG003]
MNGIARVLGILASLVLAPNGFAEQDKLAIQDLKNLKLLTQQVESVLVYPGRPTLGSIQQEPGKAYSIRSPLSAQQVTFMYPVGTRLKSGEDFVKLSGPEVHHYFSQYNVKKTMFELAAQQYKRNSPLYAQSAISQQSWIDINSAYFSAKLDYDEMQHFFELVSHFDDDSETLTLKTPIDGIVQFNTNLLSLAEEDIIASIIPLESIKLTLNVANKNAHNIAYLSTPERDCQLTVSAVESIVSGLSSKVWSSPLTAQCPYLLGQSFSVVAHFNQPAYSIPRKSVFSIGGEQFVFVKIDNQFHATAITLVSSIEQNYIATSDTPLTNAEVLTSSVSAVQGIMLGLGSE